MFYLHVCLYEGVDTLGLDLQTILTSHATCWELNLDSQEEQPVFFMAKPSLYRSTLVFNLSSSLLSIVYKFSAF